MFGEYYEGEVFENLHLDGEDVCNCEFIDCQFLNCSMENLRIQRSRFSECIFRDCVINDAKSEGGEMSFSVFERCTISGINWSLLLPNGRFSDPIQKITDCRLKYNVFTQMNFKRFRFEGTIIHAGMFAECQLADSSFRGCDLSDTEFFRCDLTRADFRKATGYRVDILSSKMKGAKFSFPDAVNLLSALDIKIEY